LAHDPDHNFLMTVIGNNQRLGLPGDDTPNFDMATALRQLLKAEGTQNQKDVLKLF
jgi:hypothetical protein